MTKSAMTHHTPSGQQAVEHLAELFRDWFKSSGIDFWDEANAPEELAHIAMRFRTAAPSTAMGERKIAAAAKAILVAADDIPESALPSQWNAVRDALRAALATPPAQVGVQENLDHAKQFLEAQGFQVFSTGPLPLPAISPAQVGEDRRLIANLMEAVGKVLFSCGEDWRCGPGAELLDAYEAAADVNINLFCSATPPPPSVPWEEQAARWHDWQASECQRIADAQRDTGSLEGFMAAKREQEWHRRIARDIRALLSKPAKGNGK